MQEETDNFYKEPTKKEWRGFWTLVIVQAQNAFNEKAVQFLLIPLSVWLATGPDASTLEYLLGAIFVLPYILFSPLVGWLTDCFCKTRIIQVMSVFQIIVMACMLYCFQHQYLEASIAWFAVFATQATILSPAKKGIVKDLLGSRYIGFGSGIIEISLVFVLLLAQIGVFFLFSYLLDYYMHDPGIEDPEQFAGWQAVITPTWVFIGLACAVAVASIWLPSYPSRQKRKFTWSLLYEHFLQMKDLWRDRTLRLSEIGISYFWCLAGSLFLVIIQIAKDMFPGADNSADFSMQCGILMAWLGGGVIIGGGIASCLCRGKNELGLIPLGAIGVTISTFMLSVLHYSTVTNHVFLMLTGAFGAMYLVPLNAHFQDNCDPANRGNIIAAGNLFDNLMGLGAVVLMWLMHEFGFSPSSQYFVLFLMSAFIMVTSLRLIPSDFVRLIGIWIMKLFYRPRIINGENIPEVGGALLVCNHVTYADALFLMMVCPRQILFIVDKDLMGSKILRWGLEMFNSVPISSKNPREAINKAAEEIEKGNLICIFPEGQLTRTGCLTPIRRGMELIARKAHAPIVPIYMDGLWGSIFSYYRNRFFFTPPFKLPRHLPYSYTVAVGKPMAEHNKTTDILEEFRRLSATCLEYSGGGNRERLIRILEKIGQKPLVHYGDYRLTGIQIAGALIARQAPENAPAPMQAWVNLLIKETRDLVALHRHWLNVDQVRHVNALKERRHPLLTSVGHEEPHEFVLGVLWPIVTGTQVYLIEHDRTKLTQNISQIVGAAHMRRLLLNVIPPRQIPFFDFSGKADIATPNTRWRPCCATPGGTIISMSMAYSTYKVPDGTQQRGMQARTRGILLPCFRTQQPSDPEDGIIISGPSLSSPYTLSNKLYLDESGFLKQLF